MKTFRILSVLFILTATSIALTPKDALAQDEDELTEEVVVVGTRGEGRNPLDSAVPVDVITAEQIAEVYSFGGELGEVLQALSPSFNFPRQSNSGLGDHDCRYRRRTS